MAPSELRENSACTATPESVKGNFISAVLQRLIDKIGNSTIDPQPSDNIYMEDVFEPLLYRELLAKLPSDEDYDFLEHPDAVLPDGTKTRRILDLTEETIARLAPQNRSFWQQMRQVLASQQLLAALMAKFRDKALERFGQDLPEMVLVPIFYRDFPGYRISIHPDAPYKIATMQFYLPKDNSQIHLGTSFHIQNGDAYNLHKTNEFKPNSAYAFFRTDYSWHSVKQLAPHEATRDTLALTVYVKGSEYRSKTRYE